MGTTLTGKRVQNTYDSLLKLGDNDNLTGVAKIVGDGLGNNSPIYLSTTQVGIGVTPSFEFHTNSHAKIGGNLIVGGNLTVDGTTTIVDSTVVAIGDNMIELAKDNVANVKDIGWYGTINSSGEKYVGMFYDASNGITTPTFRVGLGTSEPGSTMTITTKGKLVIGALDASTGVFSGQVTIPVTPSANAHAASKKYVDDSVDGLIDGSGTANDVAMWSDSDTLTDAPIAISGNNAVFSDKIGLNGATPAYTIDTGETTIGTLRMVGDTNHTFIRLGAGGGGNDVTLIRVDGETSLHDGESDSGGFGFSLKYLGALSGNENALGLYADNQAATSQIESFRVKQDGTLHVAQNTTFASRVIIGDDAITTDKPGLVVGDTTNGGQITIRGLSPTLFFDKTGANNPKILTDGSLLQIKSGTLDSEGSVLMSLTGSGGDATFAGNISAVGGSFTDPVTIYDTSTTENPRLSVGRSSGQSLEIDVNDTVATIRHNQDSDGNSNHFLDLTINSPSTGGKGFRFKQDGNTSSTYLTIDSSGAIFTGNISLGDDQKINFGAENDLQIYHNSTSGNANIENNTGSLFITNYTDDADIILRSDDGSGGVAEYFRLDGSDVKVVFSKPIVANPFLDIYKSSGTTSSATGTTMQRLWNYVGADLSQQKTFIDFVFQDDNDNEYPQVRIGAEVGQNGNADSQIKEGAGAFVVYTNNATGNGPGSPTGLAERFRVDYAGNCGIGTSTPQKNIHIEGASGASASQLLVSGPSDTIGHTAGILLRAEGGESNSALRAKGAIFFEREAANGLGKLHLCNNNSNNNDSADLSDAALTINQDKSATFVGRVDFQKDLRIRGNDGGGNLGVVRFFSDANNQLIIDTGNDGSNRTIIDGSGNANFAGSVTALGGSVANSAPLIIGSSSATNYTLQQWQTSAHGENEAYIIAYGAGHQTHPKHFAMKNLETSGEIFFELASGVEPLRLTSTNATFSVDVLPSTDSTYDLGSTTKYWANVYADNITVGDKFNAPVTIQGTSTGLLKLYQDTNGNGAAIEFSDLAATQAQKGFLSYRHSNAQSQSSGESFHFTGTETDISIVAGDSTQVGKFIASAGSTSETAFGFYDDPDTGMYQPSGNQIGFTAGGTQRMSISGDVFVEGSTDLKFTGTSRRLSFDAGTGTVRTTTANNLILQANSSTVLELKSNGVALFTGDVEIHNEGNDTTGKLTLSGNNNTGSPGQKTSGTIEHRGEFLKTVITHNGSDVITIGTGTQTTFAGDLTVQGFFTSRGIDDNADATAIIINGNEEVGIGGQPFHKLDVYGTTRIQSTGGVGLIINADTDNVTEADVPFLSFRMDGTQERLKIGVDANGNVPYISTDSDINLPLEIRIGTANTNTVKFNTDGGTTFNVSTTASYNIESAGTNAVYNRAASGDELYIGANNTYQIRLKTDNNVVLDNNSRLGVGVSSPSTKFHVNSGVFSDIVTFGNNNGGYVFGNTSNQGSLDLSSTSYRFRIRQGSREAFYVDTQELILGDLTNGQSVHYQTRIGGKSIYGASGAGPFGNYGAIVFHATTNYTGAAKRYMLSNAYNGNSFVIIRSANATTDPAIDGDSGTISSGSAVFGVDASGYCFASERLSIGHEGPAHPLTVRLDGSSGSATIVAQFTSVTSKRPTLSFAENANATISSGMSIEYNGVGSGDANYIAINSVSGSNVHRFYSGGDVVIIGGQPVIQLFANNEADFGIEWYDNQDFGQNGKIHWSASTNDMTFILNGNDRFRMYDNGDFHADADIVGFSTSISDEKLKDNVITIDNALDKVSKLRGVEYVWNYGGRKNQKDLGVIAQEVEKVLPEIVREKSMLDGDKYKTVDYEKLTAVLIESVKELSAKVEALEKKCNNL